MVDNAGCSRLASSGLVVGGGTDMAELSRDVGCESSRVCAHEQETQAGENREQVWVGGGGAPKRSVSVRMYGASSPSESGDG